MNANNTTRTTETVIETANTMVLVCPFLPPTNKHSFRIGGSCTHIYTYIYSDHIIVGVI